MKTAGIKVCESGSGDIFEYYPLQILWPPSISNASNWSDSEIAWAQCSGKPETGIFIRECFLFSLIMYFWNGTGSGRSADESVSEDLRLLWRGCILLSPPTSTHAPCTMTTISPYIPIQLPSHTPESPQARPQRPQSVSTNSTLPSSVPTSPFSLLPSSPVQLPPSTPASSSAPASLLPSPVSIFNTLLDPNLTLSARKMRAEFMRRDILFARYIVAILAQRIDLGILSPKNGIGFPFTDKDEPKAKPLGFLLALVPVSTLTSRSLAGRAGGIWSWGLMCILTERGILRCLHLRPRIWRSEGLLWISLSLRRMGMGFTSSTV